MSPLSIPTKSAHFKGMEIDGNGMQENDYYRNPIGYESDHYNLLNKLKCKCSCIKCQRTTRREISIFRPNATYNDLTKDMFVDANNQQSSLSSREFRQRTSKMINQEMMSATTSHIYFKPIFSRSESDGPFCICKGEENSLVSSEEEQSKSEESELNVVKALLAGVIKRRKNVRFADECGFCLESVQMITEPCVHPPESLFETSIVPSPSYGSLPLNSWLELSSDDESYANIHTYADSKTERNEQKCDLNNNSRAFARLSLVQSKISKMKPCKEKRLIWKMEFIQPASNYAQLRDTLEHQKIALENVTINSEAGHMYGTIKVSNFVFEKNVFLRMTCDGWKSFADHAATYHVSASQNFDVFKFDLAIPKLQKPLQNTRQQQHQEPNSALEIEFCVSFIAGENGSLGQYWDSNAGRNFLLKPLFTPASLNELQLFPYY